MLGIGGSQEPCLGGKHAACLTNDAHAEIRSLTRDLVINQVPIDHLLTRYPYIIFLNQVTIDNWHLSLTF